MITQDQIIAWGACYSPERVAQEWKRLRWPEEVPALRLARARSIPIADRLWVLLRPKVLGDRFGEVLEKIVARARAAAANAATAARAAAANTYAARAAAYAYAADYAAAAAAARAADCAAYTAYAAAARAAAYDAAICAERKAQLAIVVEVLS